MTNKKPEIKYSEPVREIMGAIPGRILKWGTTVIFSVFILFLIIAWFIKYPDLIPSPVEITTENPPVTLVSKITGRIKHFYVGDKAQVKKGDIMVVMETAASMEEIITLRNFTDSVKEINLSKENILPDLSELGELQSYYSILRKNLSELENFRKNDFYGNRIKAAKDEISGLKVYINRLKEKERLSVQNLDLEISRFSRDSSLSDWKTISQADFEKSKQALLSRKIDLQDVRLELSSKNIELSNKQQLITEYNIKLSEDQEKLSSGAVESYYNLKAQLKIWENKYLLISPIDGTVTFTKYWQENQSVNIDEPVVTIVPNKQGAYIGRIFLKMQRSGKVVVGQTVNIKLSGFPYLEYGIVQGKIKKKSLVPSGDAYVIEIELLKGLTTIYGRKLEFTQNMVGTAEIITEDRRLIEKIFAPFRYLLSKNKRLV